MICVFALTRLNIYIELVKHWVTVSEEIAEAILIQTIEGSAASSIYSIWFLTSTFLYAQKKDLKFSKGNFNYIGSTISFKEILYSLFIYSEARAF